MERFSFLLGGTTAGTYSHDSSPANIIRFTTPVAPQPPQERLPSARDADATAANPKEYGPIRPVCRPIRWRTPRRRIAGPGLWRGRVSGLLLGVGVAAVEDHVVEGCPGAAEGSHRGQHGGLTHVRRTWPDWAGEAVAGASGPADRPLAPRAAHPPAMTTPPQLRGHGRSSGTRRPRPSRWVRFAWPVGRGQSDLGANAIRPSDWRVVSSPRAWTGCSQPPLRLLAS